MKKSATKLMKELKYIECEICSIQKSDETESTVPVDSNYSPRYKTEYSYSKNREKILELFKEERAIRLVLIDFNNKTKVIGYDFTISEALIRIAQLRNEIKLLTNLASKTKYSTDYRSEDLKMALYDLNQVKDDLRKLQNELGDLQVAVDKTNLNSSIEC